MKTLAEPGDLRVRRTHRLLWEALLAEMSERPFAEITVTEICDRAMVHRTTFYKHFEDKYALLEQGIRQMYDTLLTREDHLPPNAFSVERPPPYFVRLFEHAAQHQRFYRLVLRGEAMGQFHKLFKDYLVDLVAANPHGTQPDQRQLAHLAQLAMPPDLHAHFIAGATLSLLAWWLEHDMPYSARQMAQFLMSPHGAPPSA